MNETTITVELIISAIITTPHGEKLVPITTISDPTITVGVARDIVAHWKRCSNGVPLLGKLTMLEVAYFD